MANTKGILTDFNLRNLVLIFFKDFKNSYSLKIVIKIKYFCKNFIKNTFVLRKKMVILGIENP